MSTFVGKVEGVDVEVWCSEDKISFSSPVLDEKYESFAKIERAIKAKLLALRKDFTNTSAVFVDRWGKSPSLVTVMALDGDEYAWIKNAQGKRSKERMDNLFADKEAVEFCIRNEKARNELTKLDWENLERWRPIK